MVATHSYRLSPFGPAEKSERGSRLESASSCKREGAKAETMRWRSVSGPEIRGGFGARAKANNSLVQEASGLGEPYET